jgi:hypothetical protein
MEIKTIKSFQRLKDEMEQKGYSKEQQLSILVPLYEDILGSLLDMLKSEKDKYDDFVATFQFLRAVDRVVAKDKERYCEIDRYMKNTLKYLGTKSRETADGLKEILEECTNED